MVWLMVFNVDFVKVKMQQRDAQDVKVNGIVIGNVKSRIGKIIKFSAKLSMKTWLKNKKMNKINNK